MYDLWRDAAPTNVSVARGNQPCSYERSPVPVLPALVLIEHDHDCLTELAFLQLDTFGFAFGALTSCTVVVRDFCQVVSMAPSYDSAYSFSPTRYDMVMP